MCKMGQDFLYIQHVSFLVTVELVAIERVEKDRDFKGYTNISSAKAPCPGIISISVCLFFRQEDTDFLQGRVVKF